jgi:N-acetylmuramoyl-L-alanine amidase
MGEDVNSDPIRGVAVFYRDAGSLVFSEHIYNHMREDLNLGGRGVHRYNLYICRGTWAPSALIEMGFLNNPFDYEWLTDDREQNRLILSIAEGIADYFR